MFDGEVALPIPGGASAESDCGCGKPRPGRPGPGAAFNSVANGCIVMIAVVVELPDFDLGWMTSLSCSCGCSSTVWPGDRATQPPVRDRCWPKLRRPHRRVIARPGLQYRECGAVPIETVDAIETQVRQLREAGLTPKLIARKLGVPAPTVAKVVSALAAQRVANEVVGCWISPGWSRELVVAAGRDWPDGPGRQDATGIAAALVARRHRYDKVGVCGYLVDVHCLGVKNAVGPRVMDARALTRFTPTFFAAFDGEPVPAPLELVQHLVFGAVDYARDLGLEPHPDYAVAEGHLGERTGPSAITFGRDGKPFYMQGPYDDAFAVIQTLDRTVGRGNYH